MAKDLLSRKCSHCGHNGHNSRTCSRVVKLFGVRLTATDHIGVQIRKSVSTGNLLHYRGFGTIQSELGAGSEEGYLSDGLVHTSSKSRDRKKGVPWSEGEHRMFLVGLDKLGKGDWRGISRNFVTSRTPTQVASHAQKYFLRQSTLRKRKRRSSLFDMCPHAPNVVGSIMAEDSHNFPPNFGEFGLSGGLELSVREVPSLPLCSRPEQAPEGVVSTEPQLLLPLWPELESEACRSNAHSNCKRIEPVMDDGEPSELSLSVAPPCRDTESVPTHPSCCDCDLSLSRAMSSAAAMIRVV